MRIRVVSSDEQTGRRHGSAAQQRKRRNPPRNTTALQPIPGTQRSKRGPSALNRKGVNQRTSGDGGEAGDEQRQQRPQHGPPREEGAVCGSQTATCTDSVNESNDESS